MSMLWPTKHIDIGKVRDLRKEVDAARDRAAQPPAKPVDFSLTISFSSNRTVHASDLATLICQAPGDRLSSICLQHVSVEGDFSLITQLLSNSKHLEDARIRSLRTSNPNADLASLGAALAQLPSLTDLFLDDVNFDQSQSKSALNMVTTVLESATNSIDRLTLFDIDPERVEGSEEFESFLGACGSSTTLKKLSLVPTGAGFSNRFLELAGPIVNSVVELRLRLTSDTNLASLADLATGSQSLQSLTIHRPLLHTPSLATLQSELSACYALLRNNYVLKSLNVSSWPDDDDEGSNEAVNQLVEGIDFFLNLNKIGRVQLLEQGEGATKGKWMEALAHQHDPSNIYNFLRQNPSLCLPRPFKPPASPADGNAAPSGNKSCNEVAVPCFHAQCSKSALPSNRKRSREDDDTTLVVQEKKISTEALWGIEVMQFSYETFEKSQAMFATRFGESTKGPEELRSTNILAICMEQICASMTCDALMDPGRCRELGRVADRCGNLRLTREHWVVYKYIDDDGKEWYRACFAESSLPLESRSMEGMPHWFKIGRPWTMEQAVACVPPKFRQFIAKEATIHKVWDEKIKALLFGNIEFALRMEAAFCLERLVGRTNLHWYEQKFQDIIQQLLSRVPSAVGNGN